jgi:AraC-like DNA-binding protein
MCPVLVLNDFTEECGTRRVARFVCRPGIIDPVMVHLGSVLLPAFQRPNETSALFIEHVTSAMLTHLCNFYGGAPPGTPFSKGGMTRLQANRAKEFLAAHCADDLSLVDVARACGLSRGHFTKAFRVATGLTPHQWLQRYRIDKAKDQLLNPNTVDRRYRDFLRVRRSEPPDSSLLPARRRQSGGMAAQELVSATSQGGFLFDKATALFSRSFRRLLRRFYRA